MKVKEEIYTENPQQELGSISQVNLQVTYVYANGEEKNLYKAFYLVLLELEWCWESILTGLLCLVVDTWEQLICSLQNLTVSISGGNNKKNL